MSDEAHTVVSDVDEPLLLLAPLARQWAATCCARGDHPGSPSCEPYHGLWPYLRLMGLGKTLSGHGAQFLSEVTRWARDGRARGESPRPRVLVSGSADASMLAHVLQGAGNVALEVDVTVLDQCETPLRLSAWYAERMGLVGVQVAASDVLSYRPLHRFDLIVTSSFLGYFTPSQRVDLFRNYAALMAPGARLVFSNRLRAGPEDQAVGFSPPQAEAFVEQVRTLAPGLPQACGADPDALVALARRYVAMFQSYPLNGTASIVALADAAGLQVLRMDGLHNLAAQATVSGPTTSDASPYVFVVLQRPAA